MRTLAAAVLAALGLAASSCGPGLEPPRASSADVPRVPDKGLDAHDVPAGAAGGGTSSSRAGSGGGHAAGGAGADAGTADAGVDDDAGS